MTNTESTGFSDNFTGDEMALAQAVARAARARAERLGSDTVSDWSDQNVRREYRAALDSIEVVAVAPRRVMASVESRTYSYLPGDVLDIDVLDVANEAGLPCSIDVAELAYIDREAPGLFVLTW